MKVDHIGYLVKDINKAIKSFIELGYIKETQIFEDIEDYQGKARNIYICFLKKDDVRVELVAPIANKENDVQRQLKRQGEGPYHICYKVDSLDKSLNKMRNEGYIVTKPPMPAIACGGKVAFLYKNSVGLVELLEVDNKAIKN